MRKKKRLKNNPPLKTKTTTKNKGFSPMKNTNKGFSPMKKFTTLNHNIELEVSYESHKQLTFKKLTKFFKEIQFNNKVVVDSETTLFHHSMPIAEDVYINVQLDEDYIDYEDRESEKNKNLYVIYVGFDKMEVGPAFIIPKDDEKEELKRPLTLLIESQDPSLQKYDDKYSIITDTKDFLDLILSLVRKQIKLSINK
jgi:hypothetical protein